ncbi:FAD-dependent monooxygenase [Roseimicrobium sp. ORNL1]|uniref:NAD(P)/FAD-dependent oxidoreductase n=1 Tax=Roseimicrobium sp. ORNL1 TaxID=2711231 RepID=UPI0013E153E6|nr:FAD-dependent monooxygenase [Roseimicrobium sp. ORNL1]QIF05185.1 hypothetical protein G5S37_27950 [Roseimicrobium sp. ORNL1]
MVDFDAVIVGGGVAGASAALAIARAGGRVVVLEACVAMGRRVGETLDPAAKPLLESLGVWDAIADMHHIPCPGTVSLWGAPRPAERDFIFNPYGQAWQLDRASFDEMLLSQAEQSGIPIWRGQSGEHFERVGAGWEVKLTDETVRASWLIDATGRRSSVARRLGFKRETLDQLVAIHCSATTVGDEDRDGRLFLEALPYGWCYSVLVPGGRRVFSLQTDADLLPTQEWREVAWIVRCLRESALLSRHIRQQRYTFSDPPQLTSAHSGRLERFAGDGWLAVGDAAMSFDPLSGQGILKAVKSGLQAAEVVLHNSQASREQFEAYHELMWQDFVGSRKRYYASEQRWRANSFWSRR